MNDQRMQWMTLVKKYSRDERLIVELFEELVTKYGRSNRYYHNWQHIDSMLKLCDEYAQDLQEIDVVQFAIYYHDFIYNVLRSDNEKRSANVAARRLLLLQVPAEKIEHIKHLIIATRDHRLPDQYPLSADLALFLDFDMQILGTAWETYKQYTEQVRREYQIYPSPMYKSGRRKFLEACLAQDYIFNTPQFRTRFEPAARENIAKELALYQ